MLPNTIGRDHGQARRHLVRGTVDEAVGARQSLEVTVAGPVVRVVLEACSKRPTRMVEGVQGEQWPEIQTLGDH
jgi:hypothetical protein